MRELSVFVDESGSPGAGARYYLLSLVFHDQESDLYDSLATYQQVLADRSLPDIPLHMGPLTHANESYACLSVKERMRLLTSFGDFAWHAPFFYHVFAYQKDSFASDDVLASKMKRDVVNYLFDNLAVFQSYNVIKVYYDNGQSFITDVIHHALEYVLGKNHVVYRDVRPADYRLFQMADFVCGIELVALKYDRHEEGATDRLFFGKRQDFKKNFLRKLRKKLL